MKTVVILSPYFPPSTLAGVHRARHLAKHLPAAGWYPIILCVDEACHEEQLDPVLASLVPETVEVVKVSALPARLTRPFGLGDISLRGLFAIRHRLFQLLETRQVDAVFITGSPYYPMVLAKTIKRRFGVPVILDFQDPWATAWEARQPRRATAKAWIAHCLATRLEPGALRGASHVTTVSRTQNAQLLERHPWLQAEHLTAIPIGCDPDDFAVIAAQAAVPRRTVLAAGHFNISYAGTIWSLVEPTLRVFLRAVALLRREQPSVYAKLRLNFVGTTANPNDTTGYKVLPMARAAGVADIVCEIPERRPYIEALDVVSRSDANLILGSAQPHYTASKIYPYLMSGRPYLSLLHRSSSAHEILSATGGGISLTFSNQAELEGMERDICHSLCRLITAPEAIGPADSAVYAPYHAAIIAERFAAIFDSLMAQDH